MRGQALFGGEDLLAGFAADNGLKIANHRRIRMRAENGAEKIVRSANVGDPIAHGFVDGVFQGFAAGLDADDFGAKHAHAGDVEGLASHVFGAHIDGALQAEMRGDSCRGDAVLACAGFRDDARFAHSYSEEALADGVIDFVRAGVQEIFALQINARPAELRSETSGELQRRGTAGKIFQQGFEFGLKGGVGFWLVRKRARVRRGAPSAFRERSGRRRGRSGRGQWRVW